MPTARRSDFLLRDIHDARLLEQLALAVATAGGLGKLMVAECFQLISRDSLRQPPTPTLSRPVQLLEDKSFRQRVTAERASRDGANQAPSAAPGQLRNTLPPLRSNDLWRGVVELINTPTQGSPIGIR